MQRRDVDADGARVHGEARLQAEAGEHEALRRRGVGENHRRAPVLDRDVQDAKIGKHGGGLVGRCRWSRETPSGRIVDETDARAACACAADDEAPGDERRQRIRARQLGRRHPGAAREHERDVACRHAADERPAEMADRDPRAGGVRKDVLQPLA
jgi:hypothetical protein